MRSLNVPTGVGPLRLDVFLTQFVPCSRRTAQRAIATGEVRVNGRRVRKGGSVGEGDVVEVAGGLTEEARLQPNPNLAIPVLYEDDAVVALDKPAGMPSHALRADETDTAANFLLARYPELAAVGKNDREPGVVHRLDTDTSGVLLAARTPRAYEALRRQFSAHQVIKEYVALVEGDIALPGEVTAPIAHDRHNRRKMRVRAATTELPDARPARTAYRPVERFGEMTLLAVQITTGVMHQIRVHLASRGHPIVGDHLYGTPSHAAVPRHLLHACRIGFVHPVRGTAMEIRSALAADFAGFLDAMRHKQRVFGGKTAKARRS